MIALYLIVALITVGVFAHERRLERARYLAAKERMRIRHEASDREFARMVADYVPHTVRMWFR